MSCLSSLIIHKLSVCLPFQNTNTAVFTLQKEGQERALTELHVRQEFVQARTTVIRLLTIEALRGKCMCKHPSSRLLQSQVGSQGTAEDLLSLQCLFVLLLLF